MWFLLGVAISWSNIDQEVFDQIEVKVNEYCLDAVDRDFVECYDTEYALQLLKLAKERKGRNK